MEANENGMERKESAPFVICVSLPTLKRRLVPIPAGWLAPEANGTVHQRSHTYIMIHAWVHVVPICSIIDVATWVLGRYIHRQSPSAHIHLHTQVVTIRS